MFSFIFLNIFRYSALKAVEDNRRAYEAKMAPIWAAEDAAAKEAAAKAGMADLAKQAGVPVRYLNYYFNNQVCPSISLSRFRFSQSPTLGFLKILGGS